MLIHMIETDWQPETDIQTNRSDSPAPPAVQQGPDAATPQAIDWYLYFSTREQADRAAASMRSDGLRVLVRPGATGGWLALPPNQLAPPHQPLPPLAPPLPHPP